MTLFGRTLGAEEIFAIVFSLSALVLWGMAWRGERNWASWFRGWEADRKSRRDAEIAAEQGVSQQAESPQPPREKRGPWG